MVRRTIQRVFWALVAVLALAFFAVLPAAVEARWPALLIAAALTLTAALMAHHERKHP